MFRSALLSLAAFILPAFVSASPSTNPDVIKHRGGTAMLGQGETPPRVTLTQPASGWTSAMQVDIAGSCSDPSADPLVININGTRYYVRPKDGAFARKFPVSPGRNNISVECRNKAGTASASATLNAVISPVPVKLVLTSDTDGIYTDLHIYEPDGAHVYWANTHSPSGGIFYLNNEGDSFDKPGYGPYMYVHPAAAAGVFRIDANYWPGGAMQHTLATLEVILNEGTPHEVRRRIQKPLARPDETQTLAYLVIRPHRAPAAVFVPGQDPPAQKPAEVAAYQQTVEPEIFKKKSADDGEYVFLQPADEYAMRRSVVNLALSQARRLSPRWEPAQRDCAGLVRFAYREALRERSLEQRAQLGVPPGLFLPALSARARKVAAPRAGLWQVGFFADGTQRYADFADAETLVSYNFIPVGHDPLAAKPGDLLVYRKDFAAEDPYHLMLVADMRERDGIAVYHNGASGGEGIVRVVHLNALRRSPDPLWVPSDHNPHFLGVYSWKRFNPHRPASGGSIA